MRRDKKKGKGRRACARPGCIAPAFARGLCAADYRQAWLAVKAKRTTWSALVTAGKVTSKGADARRAWLFGA